MVDVRPKKQLGQHFLHDRAICSRIVASLSAAGATRIVEIGPGMGALTGELLERFGERFAAVEVDSESISYLESHLPGLSGNIIRASILDLNLAETFGQHIALIGNLPYNISSPILFHLLEFRDAVHEGVFMLQKEVAQRIAADRGTKAYGILSVLLQAFYGVEYLFDVGSGAFIPPPKVQSGVLRLVRNDVERLACDERLFSKVVKAAFGQRRKTLKNALSGVFGGISIGPRWAHLRAEQLAVSDFVALTLDISARMHPSTNELQGPSLPF